MYEDMFTYEYCCVCEDCWMRCPDGSTVLCGSYEELSPDDPARTESFETLCDTCAAEGEYWDPLEKWRE